MGSANQRVPWGAKRLPTSREGKLSAQGTASQSDAQHDGVPEAQVPVSPPSQSVGPNRFSTPDNPFSAKPQSVSPVRPHNLRQGAARGTRSSARQDILSAFEWEALAIEKSRDSAPVATSAKTRNSQLRATTTAAAAAAAATARDQSSPSKKPKKMSRNRPRGPPVPRDNGLAANEETDMWNKILQDLRKAKEKNDKQKTLADQIAALNEKIGKEGGSKSYINLPF